MRGQDEYDSGHITGTRLLPVNTIDVTTTAEVIPEKDYAYRPSDYEPMDELWELVQKPAFPQEVFTAKFLEKTFYEKGAGAARSTPLLPGSMSQVPKMASPGLWTWGRMC